MVFSHFNVLVRSGIEAFKSETKINTFAIFDGLIIKWPGVSFMKQNLFSNYVWVFPDIILIIALQN